MTETSGTKSLLYIAIDFILVVAIFLAATQIVYFDVVVLENGLSESSLTELLHGLLILISSGCFLIGAKRYPEQRSFLVLVGTLFLCMFIRENDVYLDAVWHGFWVVPALIVFAVGLYLAWRSKGSFKTPFLKAFESSSFTFVYLGFMLLVVFSRLFGTGSLWEPVLGEAYQPGFKTVVQEGVELMAYGLICYGSIRFMANRFR